MKRRMAAILVADVVGFSGLMEADEEGTARQLASCRNQIDAEIGKYDGRLFKAMGDAVLVEFASPINALRCAVDIRSRLALASQNDGQQPLRMRFGLHVADVLVENDDLIGDGVNLAARIQQAADPDAIDVSGALFEQVRRNSPFAFDDRGKQDFRNITQPVHIYRLRGEILRHVYQVAPTQPTPSQAKRPHSIAVLPIEVPGGNAESLSTDPAGFGRRPTSASPPEADVELEYCRLSRWAISGLMHRSKKQLLRGREGF
jgi:class 3 adenylate cyclase